MELAAPKDDNKPLALPKPPSPGLAQDFDIIAAHMASEGMAVDRSHLILQAGLISGLNVHVSNTEVGIKGRAYRKFKESRTPLEFRQHHHEIKCLMGANNA